MSRQARRSSDEWKRLVTELEQSGLSRQQFATERGVNWRSLENWYYRFRRESLAVSRRTPTVEFVPVKVRAPRLAAAAVTPERIAGDVIETRVGTLHVRFCVGTDCDYLGRLFSALSRDVAC